MLERPGPEQEVHDTPLVRLEPVQLDRRHRPQVEPIDVDRVDQRPLELPVVGDRRANERRPDFLQHLLLWALDTVAKGNMYSFLAMAESGESLCMIVGRM